jgi:hypothetical protein
MFAAVFCPVEKPALRAFRISYIIVILFFCFGHGALLKDFISPPDHFIILISKMLYILAILVLYGFSYLCIKVSIAASKRVQKICSSLKEGEVKKK